MLLFVLLVYLLTAPGHLQTIDMSSELAVGRSLVEHLTFAVPRDMGVRGMHGLIYSPHAFGESLLLLPAVLVGQLATGGARYSTMVFVASLLTVAIAAAMVSILYLFALDLGARVRTAAVTALVFAFCTMQWSYAHDAFDITPTACSLLVALFAAHRLTRYGPRRWLLISGWAFAGAVLLRVPSMTLWPVYGAYLFMSWPRSGRTARLKALSIWSSPTLMALAFTGWYDWLRFGTPLQTGYGLGGDNGFSYPLWQGLAGLLISPGKSLFLYSPVLVLSILGYRRFLRRDRALALTVLGIVACTLVFYGRFDDWSGDWAWGPRFLLPLIPLLMLPAAGVFEVYPACSRRLRAGIGILVGASLLVQLLSVLVDYQVQMEITLSSGRLPLMYWTPRYSQIAVQADAVWQVLRGTAIYPEMCPARSHLRQPACPISWDFWWLADWRAHAVRWLLLLVLSLSVAMALMAGAWIAGRVIRGPGAIVLAGAPGVQEPATGQYSDTGQLDSHLDMQ